MRKLASIQRVVSVGDIPDADAICKVQVMAWECVSKKNEFKEGDMGVYFEIDSILPPLSVFEFMKPRGYRVKTIRLRGQLSQGLMMPISCFDQLKDVNLEEGTDVTEILGVQKYEPPQDNSVMMGQAAGGFPGDIPKTDEPRIQSNTYFIDFMKGKPYYITEKCDGTSCTVYWEEGELRMCSRGVRKKLGDESCYNRAIRKYAFDRLQFFPDYVLQGEVCGPKMQKNRLQLKEFDIFIFNVFNRKTGKYLSFKEYVKFIEDLNIGVKTVPIVEVGESFDYTIEQLLEKAKGKYAGTDNHREGIVIRSQEEEVVGKNKERLSFKAINNDYLEKGGT